MNEDTLAKLPRERVWLDMEACHIKDFAALVERTTKLTDYPFAAEILYNIPLYDSATIRKAAVIPEQRMAVMAEWVEAIATGPGAVVLGAAFADTSAVDAATAHFEAIIAEQHANNTGGGDHFAKPGANDRIWNALEKLCLRVPEVFAAYYGNDLIALICEAWLGPSYQITSQVNCVNPGGAAQSAHRDYHLGFLTPEMIQRYPAHVHRLSPMLTLQGAVAHCDMPLESGPTLYLPFSQTYEPGYLAAGRPEFQAYFAEHHVQLPLNKGDAVFFNPALYHAAGNNRSKNILRMANLLQVSSAYGRAMESVDRMTMCGVLYPVLRSMLAAGRLTSVEAASAIAASAEGYSFPTSLDLDPPIGGLAPETQSALMSRALNNNWETDAFISALKKQARRRFTCLKSDSERGPRDEGQPGLTTRKADSNQRTK